MKNIVALFTLVVSLFGGVAAAQDKKPVPVTMMQAAGPVTPLRVLITVSRWDGDKKISSLPYTLAVNANDGSIMPDGHFMPFNVARLRTGAKVPVPSIAPPQGSPIQGAMGPVTYQPIGTNIDCWAAAAEDGRFKININVEDTSVYVDGKTAPGVAKIPDIPSFRTFQSENAVVLRDGQSTQFTAAADKISGEVTKVDVTITVVK